MGGAAGVLLFCLIERRPFRPIFDALAIPTAFILGCGRIGNFIDGQIFGSVTDVPWAVKFPEVDGFRHPVVLYDGLKNFLLIPVLMWVRRQAPPPGRLAAVFVFLYAALRIPIDLLREYPITLLGLPTGQALNIFMSLLGIVLLVVNWRRGPVARAEAASSTAPERDTRGLMWRRIAFAVVLCLALVIPSDATRDIPALYGKRHAGLTYSWLYPRIN